MTVPARAQETQADLFPNPKRGSNERTGIHAWFPYYAGFSAAFVESTLKRLPLEPGAVVADPMNGSGTTTLVAQQRGFQAIGNELNPAMAIIARAKDASLRGGATEIEALLRTTKLFAKKTQAQDPDPRVLEWFSRRTFDALKSIESAIDRAPKDHLALGKGLRDVLPPRTNVASGPAELLRAALLITVRRNAQAVGSKNPTWFKPGRARDASISQIWAEFVGIARRLQLDVDEAFPCRPRTRSVAVLEGDARKLAIRESSVDAIITSPPYLTRIDYAVSTAPELVFLGYQSEDRFHGIRSAIMGSTCIIPGDHIAKKVWGASCNDVLERVRNHASKASRGYYYKTHVQYFRDAELLLAESLRVLKPKASAFFVVQDSWYKDVHVPLDKIYSEMSRALGAREANVVSRVSVKSHMGLVNTRSRKWAKGELSEHVVRVTK